MAIQKKDSKDWALSAKKAQKGLFSELDIRIRAVVRNMIY
jgi:hypothetical protein